MKDYINKNAIKPIKNPYYSFKMMISGARPLVYNGEKRSIREWAAKLEIPEMILRNRISTGWSVEKALTTLYKKV